MVLRQNLDHIATLLHNAGITRWAVSPGSRNAPIVAGMIRHGGFELHSFPDERCAAYAALGMSQAIGYPCGVICTSGTAVLNLYPGICEAYYQRIPLVVITADRPEELLDQWDGQTIHQKEIYEKHILRSFETPDDLDSRDCKPELGDMIYNAVETTLQPVCGPVHINVPLRDPIYKGLTLPFEASQPEKPLVFKKKSVGKIDIPYLHSELSKYSKILIVAGQLQENEFLRNSMRTVSLQYPVLADITANLPGCSIPGWDLAMNTGEPPQGLKPELLITIGLSVVSKPLKLFIKQNKPTVHWHIASGGFTGDPFESQPLTHELDPVDFMDALTDITGISNDHYLRKWQQFALSTSGHMPAYQPEFISEFQTVKEIMDTMPQGSALHLGNSMTVRYASWAGETAAEILVNRGTSGIDGTLSTAVGFALAAPERQVFCILGDVSFFYDSNALWTADIPKNLGIVVLNNRGGAIFDFINGPSAQKDLMPYIRTPHKRIARQIAEDFNIRFLRSAFENPDITSELIRTETPFILEVTHERK